MKLVWGAVAVAAGLAAMPAMAEEIGIEARGGLFAHSVDESGDLFGVLDTSRIEDFNAELLFSVPSMTQWVAWGELRPHVGATVNFGDLESMVYGGVSWTVPLLDTPFFIEASFGGAFHNGSTSGNADYPARDLGCSWLFRESASVGVNITQSASIMATIEHASNANLCDDNRGLTNLGLRVGWRF